MDIFGCVLSPIDTMGPYGVPCDSKSIRPAAHLLFISGTHAH